MGWGASLDDWAHWEVILGLGEDLLPVVSNPHTEISRTSTIKQLGKLPSLYNRDGKVVGIADWTQKKATSKEIASWSKNPDYGTCLQTRNVRAIDVDVEDVELVEKIKFIIFTTIGRRIPTRCRVNSAKCLMLFKEKTTHVGQNGAFRQLEDVEVSSYTGQNRVFRQPPVDFSKRILPIEGGIIEILGTGQQCIVDGTHTSGTRYVWEGGLPDSIPEVDFEAVWEALLTNFGNGMVNEYSARKPKSNGYSTLPASDATSEALEVLGLALGVGREGQVYLHCPWKAEHTDGGKADSETGTAYFPAGGRGYAQGHFKCLHAHCAGRSDEAFRIALGLEEAGGGFEVLEDEPEGAEGSALPVVESRLPYDLKLNDAGQVIANIPNVTAVLGRPKHTGIEICYDVFLDAFVCRGEAKAWRPFKDTDYTQLRKDFELTGFLPIGSEMMRDCVKLVAKSNRIDTAQQWLSGLQWDGTPRVSTFLEKYLSVESSDYTKGVSEYMWVAMAGRIIEPGCKADAAPIFIGEQYVGKSLAVESLVPDVRMFTEITLDSYEDDLSRKMRGKLVAELAELRGLNTKELEGIKAFVSRRYEEWVPKYEEFTTLYPRRLLFIGTSNKDEIFADETGNRRWFPVRVIRAHIEDIVRDRDQLWAEAAVMFNLEGGVLPFYDKANRLAGGIREEFMISDPWEDGIQKWLERDEMGEKPCEREYLRIGDIAEGVLGQGSKNIKQYDMVRIGKIMRKFGYEKRVKRFGRQTLKVWGKSST